MMYYLVEKESFSAANLNKGDLLKIEDAPPKPGDFTLLWYDNECQLVWLLGYDFLKHPIICQSFDGFPEALSVSFPIELKGRAVKTADKIESVA